MMRKTSFPIGWITGFLSLWASGALLGAEAGGYFQIRVIDRETGRGVPLVEMRTVNKISYWTDSQGIIAFDEPGLMGQEVYFHVSGHGYEFPKDGFGNRGIRLKPVPGGEATVRVERINIAERLYRITGQGIYRDSILLGLSTPLREPVLNGLVLGQDTVIATPYKGKIYWFWGDTDRAAYPLGNFGASGAVSLPPGRGGLDPSRGIDLEYFVDSSGFSKPMCPNFGPGLQWIESVMVVRDEAGEERLVARVSSQKGLTAPYAWHLAVFNEEKEIFESKVRLDLRDGHDAAHPFRARVDGMEYLFLYPNLRVKPDLKSLADPKSYEAFTCVTGDGRVEGSSTRIDRDADGKPRYSWKAGADRLHAGRLRRLVSDGKLKQSEAWVQLRDYVTGDSIQAGRGSVYWNDYRQRWVMLVSAAPGEIWFAEGDTPVGPWVYARRVVEHQDYNFYNPTQHPFFDQDGGRLIYFEGTYTAAFSGARQMTPRYDYNQIMYRLVLDDPRLNLPVPVYRVSDAEGGVRYLTRETIQKERLWDAVEELAFFAFAPDRGQGGMAPVFEGKENGHRVLANAPGQGEWRLVFFCLPAISESPPEEEKRGIVPLYEYADSEGRRRYSTRSGGIGEGWRRKEAPVCRVWENPATVLIFDPKISPVPSD